MTGDEDFKAMAMAVHEKYGDDQDLDLKAFAHIEDQIGRELKQIEKATIRYYLDQSKSGRVAMSSQEQGKYDPDQLGKWK